MNKRGKKPEIHSCCKSEGCSNDAPTGKDFCTPCWKAKKALETTTELSRVHLLQMRDALRDPPKTDTEGK
jgi:hypothetical protein